MIPLGAALSAGVPCAVLGLGGLEMVSTVEKVHVYNVPFVHLDIRICRLTHMPKPWPTTGSQPFW